MEETTSEPTSTIAFKIVSIERDILALKTQIKLSISLRENDLNLQIVHGIIARMGEDVENTKIQVEHIMKKQIDLGNEAISQLEAQKRRQTALQIKYLWGIISIVISFGISVLVGYVTHLFH